METMITLPIKPLSVNECWRGRRFKTDVYKKYEKDVVLLLPRIKIPEGKLSITFEFGFRKRSCDIDNPCKPLLDILQTKYGFNDNKVYELIIYKKVVKEGPGYIMFSIKSFSEGSK